MKISISFLCLFLVFSSLTCDNDDDPMGGEGGLLDDLIRVEAQLNIRACDFVRDHQVVEDEDYIDDVNINFDSRDGTTNIDSDNNSMRVEIDYTGFLGTEYLGYIEASLDSEGGIHLTDFEASVSETNETVFQNYAFKVENLEESSDEVIEDVSKLRYLRFEVNGAALCVVLDRSMIIGESGNPVYFWNSNFSFSEELIDCDCQDISSLIITYVFDAN